MEKLVVAEFEYNVKSFAVVKENVNEDSIIETANELSENNELYYESYEELLEIILEKLGCNSEIIEKHEIEYYNFDKVVEVDLQYMF